MNEKYKMMEKGGWVNHNIVDTTNPNEFLLFTPQQEKEIPVYARMMVKRRYSISIIPDDLDENMPYAISILDTKNIMSWATNKYINLYGCLLGSISSNKLLFTLKKKDEDDIILLAFPGCIFSPDRKRILFLITSTKQDWEEPKEALKAYVSKELIEDPIYKTFYRKFEKEFLADLRENSIDVVYTSSDIRKRFFVSKIELGINTLDGIQKYLKGKDAKSDLFFDPVTEAIKFLKKVREKNFSVFRNVYNSLPNEIKKGLPPNLVPFEFGSITEEDVMETVLPLSHNPPLRHGTGIWEQMQNTQQHHYSELSIENVENAIRDVDEEMVHSFNSHTIQQRLDDLRRLNNLSDSYTTEELEQLNAITPEMARTRRFSGHHGFGATSSPISDDNPLNRDFTVEERALEELRRGQRELAGRILEEERRRDNEITHTQANPYRGRY